MIEVAKVFIYSEPRCKALNYDELAAYVRGKLPRARVLLRGPLLESAVDGSRGSYNTEFLAAALARAKVRDLGAPARPSQPVLKGEIQYELSRLKNLKSNVFGFLYDAGLILDIYRQMLPAAESRLECANIIFTNQLIGSWKEADKRYHARSVILGGPTVVSISGIVEAPAKAAGFYIARRTSQALGLPGAGNMEWARALAGDHLQLDDSRLTNVAKGLILQALSYRMTDEPFCEDSDCRLYNAHRQSELIRSQFGEKEFCQRHDEIFARNLRE